MLETPHSLLGGAIGAATGNPVAAAGLATASHFAGDYLPHWNPKFPVYSKKVYVFIVADFTLALALVPIFYVLFPDQPEIAVGAFFGCLPDIVLGFRFTFKLKFLRAYEKLHETMQWEVPFWYGIWPQLAVSVGSAAYLLSQ